MALIEREKLWELVGEMAETVRPGSKLEGVMRRYANAIDNAPAVDAIPVEWLMKRRDIYLKSYHAGHERDLRTAAILNDLIIDWRKEQKA